MRPDRSVLLHLSLTATLLFALDGNARALVVCRTPDGATYATDNPPPECSPIPNSEIEKFGSYQAEERSEGSVERRSRRDVEEPAPPPEVAQPAPYDAPIPAEPRRAEESPASEREHAIASCEQAVAEQLEMPSSARWPNRGDYKFRESGGGRVEVQGHVDAEKAVGSTQIDWTCSAAFAGDRWIATAQLREKAPGGAAEARAQVPPASAPPPSESIPSTAAMPPRGASATIEQRPSGSYVPPANASAYPPEAPSYPPPPPTMPSEASGPAPVSAYAAPPSDEAELWKERSSCPGMRFDAATEKHANEGYQIVSGEITYTGMRPIRDVRVCASGTCTQVRGSNAPMTSGASDKFTLRITTLETPVVTSQCSVQIAGPGS